MPRPDTNRSSLLVFALCAIVAVMAAGRHERTSMPGTTASGVAFAAQLGDAAISLSWR